LKLSTTLLRRDYLLEENPTLFFSWCLRFPCPRCWSLVRFAACCATFGLQDQVDFGSFNQWARHIHMFATTPIHVFRPWRVIS